MNHPFASLQNPCAWLIALAVITVSFMLALLLIGPPKIVNLEFAGTPAVANKVIAGFGAKVTRLKPQLYVDFGFMAAYSTFLAAACFIGADACRANQWPMLATVGLAIAWLQWVAGGLDAVENISLLTFLGDRTGALWPLIARYSALAKFALAIVGCGYGAFALWMSKEPSSRICFRVFSGVLVLTAIVFALGVYSGLKDTSALQATVATK